MAKENKTKSLLGKYVKRALLIIITFVVVVFASVYFLGKYKAIDSNIVFNNEYDDSYWQNLEGFEHYETVNQAYLSSILGHPMYEPPYEEYDTFTQRLRSARYLQELEEIYEECKKDSGLFADPEYSTFESTYLERKIELEGIDRNKYHEINFKKCLVLENDKYRLYFNRLDTTFSLVEIDANGEEINQWLSNPEKIDKNYTNEQKSQLIVTFCDGSMTSDNQPIIYTNYEYSVYENTGKQVNPNFYTKIVKDEDGNAIKLQVYYILKERGINYTYFPKVLTAERKAEIIENSYYYSEQLKEENEGEYALDASFRPIQGFVEREGEPLTNTTINFLGRIFDTNEALYEKDQDTGLYTLKKYETMGDNDKNALYSFFYEWCGYTFDELVSDKKVFASEYKEDNIEEVEKPSPKIEIAVEYELTDKGLDVMIPGNSIKANKDTDGDEYLIYDIDVLPYFAAAKTTDTGYFVIPDGSGAVMEYNNGRTTHDKYKKRVYSTDLSVTSFTLTESTNDLMFPMYASVFTNNNPRVMVTEVTSGAAQARLNADISGKGGNSYNNAFYTLIVREWEKVNLTGQSWEKSEKKTFTNTLVSCDYHINYMPLDTNEYEASYNGVAKFYRELLISRSDGKLDVNADKTTTATLDLEILGAYTYDANFLGIGYTGKGTLTTVSELDIILDEIMKLGVANTNVYYHGWRNGALEKTSFSKLKFNKDLGSKKDLLDLINKYNKSVTIYPHVDFMQYENFTESFGRTHYTARKLSGEYATSYPYELNSNIWDVKNAKEVMTLSPAYYDAFSKELAKNYSKLLEINSLSISGLGSKLSGNYRKNKNIFKTTAVEEQIKSFENLLEKGIDKLALEMPYDFGLEYASNAYNLPYQSTQYDILNYSIPFYQLVINGLFDYSGQSVNANSEVGLQDHIMRCIETGSNPAFTLTYDDSTELLRTDYNEYYYTLYTRWLSDIKSICDELNSLEIYSCNLVAHEYISSDVYKVTYKSSDDTKTIEIVLNYSRNVFNYNGQNISAKSYKVI